MKRLLSKIALTAVLVAAGCLPNPQSVKERRDSFDRDGLEGSVILERTPAGMIPVEAVFGRRIKLVGYEMDPKDPKPGNRVAVTFYWSAIKPIAEDYQVFIHGDALEGKASRIHGDHYPGGGDYPTDVWQVGEIIADRFKLWIPPGYGARRLGIHTGLYKKNYRVPLTNKGKKASASDNRSRPIEIVFR